MSLSLAPVDIAWIAICTSLVILMQIGFCILETGFVRAKNSINVAVKNLADFSIAALLFWAFGYAVMFGASAAGWYGTSGFLFGEQAGTDEFMFFVFQMAFCGTATTIVSGAVAERMRFSGYLLTTAVIAGIIYPIAGHWAWAIDEAGNPAGWLGASGFIDFAGSTVVHSVGGWVALVAIILIGARRGRFSRRRRSVEGHNMALSAAGTLTLWVGWFGFNGGSALGVSETVPLILVNTALAGAAGGVASLGYAWLRYGRPRVDLLVMGPIAGLVGVTANCNIIVPVDAVIIGAIAGVVAGICSGLLERCRIDDVVGAVPSHLAAGIWGTIAVALFGDPAAFGDGVSRLDQLSIQVGGVAAIAALSLAVGFGLLVVINAVLPLRVTPRQERAGLNEAEHGAWTPLNRLITQIERQGRSGDFSRTVPIEPGTDAGRVARQYNRVLQRFRTESTQRGMAVEEAVEARGLAESANRSKSQFIARMSHELRTPLNAIIGFAELLTTDDDQKSAERRSEYAREVLEGGRQLLDLVNEILDFSKIDVGRIDMAAELLDVRQLVAAVHRTQTPRAERSGVGLSMAVDPQTPPILGDRQALTYAIRSLLSNAIKFTPAGGFTSIRAGLDDRGDLRIAVSDTGVGMTAEQIHDALQPFSQIDDVLTGHRGGSGLGLPFSRTLVELHGGSLRLESIPSVGTQATIVLPASRLQPPPRRSSTSAEQADAELP